MTARLLFCWPSRVRSLIRRLAGDQRGAVMMILGLIVIPLFALIGLAVDVGRGYMLKSKLSYAIDAAGLAGGRAFDQDNREQEIMMFFEANFPDAYMGSALEGGQPSVTFDDEESTIFIQATATIPTRFMGVAGVQEMRIGAQTLIRREMRGMELVLVMDNTGSMRGGGKMGAMKDAAQDLVDILYGSREEVPNFWVGLVPYAATVNIGTQHADWLIQQAYDADAAWQNADPDSSEQFGYHPDHYEPTSWRGCVETRPYPRDSNDDTPADEGWYPHLWRTTLRLYENPYWTHGPSEYVVVVEDQHDAYDDPSNVIYEQGSPSHPHDDPEVVEYDEDDPWTWGRWLNGDNDWDPDGPLSDLREENSAENLGTGPNLGCGPAITPLVAGRTTVSDAIAEMQPWHRGGTFANQGLAWGWRVLSPRWRGLWDGDDPTEMPLDYNEDNMEKVVILLTDGVNQWYDWPGHRWSRDGEDHYSGLPGSNQYPGSYDNEFRNEWPGADYTAYGRLNEGRLGTTNNNAVDDVIDDRMLEMCTAMKAEGIIMYTITFQENNSATQQLFRDCASGDDHYFHAPSNSDLAQTFVQIADELSNLRIAE